MIDFNISIFYDKQKKVLIVQNNSSFQSEDQKNAYILQYDTPIISNLDKKEQVAEEIKTEVLYFLEMLEKQYQD